MSEQFSLRWNDFHTNLSQSFQALLDGEDLVDVTLAAGGQYVHAHKLILSVCSPYFKELFKMNPCDHPIVILKDVAHQELRQLLQFMYRGEVHVRQQELFAFLHTAELLQIKGLTSGREHSESPPLVSDENKGPDAPEPSGDSQTEWVPGGEDTIATETPADFADAYIKVEAARSPLKSEPLIDFDSDVYNNVLVMPESAKESSGWNCKSGGVKCPSCHRYFANRYNLKVHIRDKHDTREGTLQCDICQKHMRNPSCLRVHMYHHRKQAAYLAQVGTQSGQMRHVVQNIVTSKWRSDSSIGSNELKDGENMSAQDGNNGSDAAAAAESVVPKAEAASETA